VSIIERAGVLPERSGSNWWKERLLRHAVHSPGDLGNVHVVDEKVALRTGRRYVTATLGKGPPAAALLLPGGGAMVIGDTFTVRSTP